MTPPERGINSTELTAHLQVATIRREGGGGCSLQQPYKAHLRKPAVHEGPQA